MTIVLLFKVLMLGDGCVSTGSCHGGYDGSSFFVGGDFSGVLDGGSNGDNCLLVCFVKKVVIVMNVVVVKTVYPWSLGNTGDGSTYDRYDDRSDG